MASSEDDIKLVISIDENVSLNNMQGQIRNLLENINSQDHEISVSFRQSDLATMRSQISEIIKSVGGTSAINLQTNITDNGAAAAVANSMAQIQSTAASAVSGVQQLKVSLGEMSVVQLEDAAAQLQRLGISDSGIQQTLKSLQEMGVQIDSVKVKIANLGAGSESLSQVVLAGANAFGQSVTHMITYDKETGEIEKSMTTVSSKIKEATQATKEHTQATQEDTAAAKEQQETEEERNNTINSAESAIKSAESALTQYTAAKYSNNQSSKDAYNTLQSETDALKSSLTQYKEHTITRSQLDDQIRKTNEAVKTSTTTFKTNGDAIKSMGERITGVINKLTSFVSVTRVLMETIKVMKQMVSTAVEIDDAMTQLRIVTDETEASYSNYSNTISKTAQELSASITDLVDATTTYARLGYSLDESSTLAEYTAMLQNVGDIDESDAQDAITSIVKAFDVSIDDIETIMDELVAVGNNYPISVSQLAEGMTNASSTLAAAGNTFEESVALLTAANTTINLCRAA